MFETVIVPLDGTQHAEVALPYAIAEARFHGAGLVLLRIIARPEPCLGVINHGGPLPAVPWWPPHELTAAEAQAGSYLRDVVCRYELGHATQLVTAVGEPYHRLQEEVRRHPRPLVVMTTGDPAESPPPYLSDVAHQLLASGEVLVLAVREPAQVATNVHVDPIADKRAVAAGYFRHIAAVEPAMAQANAG
jgi:nucleotide-binding universal stress UspA family protein